MEPQLRTRNSGAPDVIVELSRKTERPVEEVARVYTQQLHMLEAYATVKTYVSVLARRRTQEALSNH